ncbi:hypothetical protein [Vibrio harveyi]|uniref:hypothetical protein n=1 Tax=Vibrio harveyi TaxID=669 RepID=UPI001143EDA5|nr:hypothetical protein [Vibrio harveyi]
MYTEQQREYMRDLLIAALADYQKKVGGTDASAIIKTQGYEKIANAMSCQQSRPRGTSKENCSPDVFEHIQLLRLLQTVPLLNRKWLKYRYSEEFSGKLATDLIEVVIGELEYFAGRKQKVSKLRKMVEKIVISRRDLVEFQQKDLADAMNINRTTLFRSYREHSEETSQHLNKLDNQSLDLMLSLKGVEPYKLNS